MLSIVRQGTADASLHVTFAPAFPLDAHLRSLSVDGRAARFDVTTEGDVQRAVVTFDLAHGRGEAVFQYDEGSDAYVRAEAPPAGARSEGLRILRSRAETGALHLRLEGVGGRTYALRVRSPRRLEAVAGTAVRPMSGGSFEVTVAFDGPPEASVRRDLALPLR